MKRLTVLLFTSLLTLTANANIHKDCTQLFKDIFLSESIEKISLESALGIAYSPKGKLGGAELTKAAQILGDAKQVYAVTTFERGWVATDLIAATEECSIKGIFRVKLE